MSADFFSFVLALEQVEPAQLAGFAAAETEYNGNVYVDVDAGAVMELDGAETATISPNFAALVAIDRFAARPANLQLLDNHAFRWVPPGELAAFRLLWTRLLAACGGADGIVAKVAPWLDRGDNGAGDVRETLAAVDTVLRDADRTSRGVLLLCVPC